MKIYLRVYFNKFYQINFNKRVYYNDRILICIGTDPEVLLSRALGGSAMVRGHTGFSVVILNKINK